MDVVRTEVANWGKSSATFTRPNDSTPYTALDVVGSPLIFVSDAITSQDGAQFTIRHVTYKTDEWGTVATGQTTFRLHLFDAQPTTIADNVLFKVISADRNKYLGFMTITLPVAFSETQFGECIVPFTTVLATDAVAIYGVLQTVTGWTPSPIINTWIDIFPTCY